ncbi:hypothetical protein [Roseibium sediminicola]|uniref:Glycosyltransferase RgtA/B/C/D-like domain-containing protein n=1 Tax=Roseibium sediminicola TaxID=2933272 RepID=A0ABT0H342_9HYPH|nr:hypothetical protein [Roseibium sp. CAU 1639]MCK7616081.1 hypothetical protein [Roseibium sp. CAU 1639]
MTVLATYVMAAALSPILFAALFLKAPLSSRSVGFFALMSAVVLIALSAALPQLIFDHERYLHDLWTAFETANKAASGLASSTDYFSPIGPVYDWVFRIAVAIRPLGATTVPLASSIFAFGVLMLALAALGRQLSLGTLGLVTLIAVATIVSPREPDMIFAQTTMSWLAPYNRWAAGLTAIVAAAFICPPGRRGSVEAVLLGVCLALVLLTKVTFGAALAGLLVAALVFRNVAWQHAGLVVAGSAAFLAVAEVLTGQVSANLADIRTVSGFAGEGWRLIKLLSQMGEAALWAVGSAALYLLLCEQLQQEKRVVPVLLMATAAAMAWVILMQNHWVSESPVYAVLPVVAAEWAGLFRRGEAGDWMPARLSGRILAGLAVLLALTYPARDGGTLIAQWARGLQYPENEKLAGTGQAGFLIYPRWFDEPDSKVVVDYKRMLDGLDLLRRAGADQPEAGPVLALNFANPFPALMNRPSPAQAPVWFQKGRIFSEDVHQPAEVLFSDADYVMRAHGDPAGADLWDIYGPYVLETYAKQAESPYWTLYRKKQ